VQNNLETIKETDVFRFDEYGKLSVYEQPRFFGYVMASQRSYMILLFKIFASQQPPDSMLKDGSRSKSLFFDLANGRL
jgi:hypothetical protein